MVDAEEATVIQTKAALFQKFWQLNVQLAQTKRMRLNKSQMEALINSPVSYIPPEEFQLSDRLGFVKPALTPSYYVFPLAHVLSFTPSWFLNKIVGSFLEKDLSGRIASELARKIAQRALNKFTGKIPYIVQAREGLLTGKRMTLQQVGNELGITRERVRQLEKKFWETLQNNKHFLAPFLTSLLYKIISKQGSLIVPLDSQDFCFSKFLAKCAGIPVAELSHIGIGVLGIFPKDLALSEKDSLFDRINHQSLAHLLELKQLPLSKEDLMRLAQGLAQYEKKHLTMEQKVYIALKSIGKPAHYSKIAEAYNLLFPETPSPERNVHAVLGREQQGIVWIGIKGTFALKEWGYEHPSSTLFETVKQIVEEKYEETKQPVPLATIIAEIGKHRPIVKRSSLMIATNFNPDLERVAKNFFIPRKSKKMKQDEEISLQDLDRILREFESDSPSSRIQKSS
ncbi:MAG: sigma factor-like helix-turn-helix DNA-binding protein [Candidatus Freyarchaeota archaeon]